MFITLAKKNQAVYPNKLTTKKRRNLPRAFYLTKEKPRGAPQGGIKQQNDAKVSLGIMGYDSYELSNPSIYNF